MGRTIQPTDKFVPDGKRISELRRIKEMKQISMAESLGISERKLRAIETKNLPLRTTLATEIADKLGVPLAQINLSKVEGVSETAHVELRPVTGGELLAMARSPEEFMYHLLVDVTSDQTVPILQILSILKIYIDANKVDPKLDIAEVLELDFPDVLHSAQLNDAMKQLKGMQIGVLANTYSFGKKMPWERVLVLAFVSADKKTATVEKNSKHYDWFELKLRGKE